MTNQLKFGIQTNGIKHTSSDDMPSINERFLMVKETGIFDYVDKTPEDNEIENFKLASDRYNIPIRAGGWFYTIGDHKELLEKNLKTAKIDTAFELSPNQLDAIKLVLEKRFNKEIEIEQNLDSTLLAGAVVRIDDLVIDGSLREQLRKLESQLI